MHFLIVNATLIVNGGIEIDNIPLNQRDIDLLSSIHAYSTTLYCGNGINSSV